MGGGDDYERIDYPHWYNQIDNRCEVLREQLDSIDHKFLQLVKQNRHNKELLAIEMNNYLNSIGPILDEISDGEKRQDRFRDVYYRG